MKTVCSNEIKMIYTLICSKSHNATATIAAHHASGTIRIEICHLEIDILSRFQQHKSIRTHSITTVTKIRD